MEEIYRLGKHEFATREEWEAAQRDLETITGPVEASWIIWILKIRL